MMTRRLAWYSWRSPKPDTDTASPSASRRSSTTTPAKGRVSESDVEFRAPYEPGEGTLWTVVHDNRAGAAFVVVPLHVK